MFMKSSTTALYQRLSLKINANKEIFSLVIKLQESRHILLKNFEVFKTYITEKLILPLQNNEELQNDLITKIKINVFESLIK